MDPIQGNINILEKVQEHMVNMIPSLCGKSYEEKMAEINIKRLAAHQTRADLIKTFKIIKGVDDVNHKHWFKLFGTADRKTRLSSYPLNIIVKPARKDVRKNFFLTEYETYRMIYQPRREKYKDWDAIQNKT